LQNPIFFGRKSKEKGKGKRKGKRKHSPSSWLGDTGMPSWKLKRKREREREREKVAGRGATRNVQMPLPSSRKENRKSP
jgi:hypothetical protein